MAQSTEIIQKLDTDLELSLFTGEEADTRRDKDMGEVREIGGSWTLGSPGKWFPLLQPLPIHHFPLAPGSCLTNSPLTAHTNLKPKGGAHGNMLAGKEPSIYPGTLMKV